MSMAALMRQRRYSDVTNGRSATFVACDTTSREKIIPGERRNQSVASLKGGDKLDALDAQEVAAESLEAVKDLVEAVKFEPGYVSEIVEFLHLPLHSLYQT